MSLAFLVAAFSGVNLKAAEPTKAELEFFEAKVRPLLVNQCYKCHSHESEKLKGGLSVEYRESLRKGGHTGPAIVPGNPDKSLLIQAVRYQDPDLQMPPAKNGAGRLADADIAILEQWVKMDAPDPRTTATAGTNVAAAWSQDRKEHWAFQPVKKVTVPKVENQTWGQSPVDNFILAKLEENGLKPSPPADKRTLLRRATFDLTGLPPTPEELDNFLADNSPEAFAKVVDRLLASPQYGERWGRYWLDVARYADTKGDFKQKREAGIYPHAWTYRDYVVKSFNDDKPYNRFIAEQLAADKMPLGTNQATLAALGFLTVGDHFGGMKQDVLNDQIDVVTKGFLGITVTCARCHDHKFDPISQRDYYALHGIFNSSEEPEFGPLLMQGVDKANPDYLDYAKKFRALFAELTALENKRNKEKTKEDRDREGELRRDIAQLEMKHPGAPPRPMLLTDLEKPRDSHVFIRGEAGNPGDLVPRRFPEILGGSDSKAFRTGSGRLDLAAAIINPTNPLTARVIVNRLWLHHFGEGIVTTPDDFGNQSEPPSHPELLDYLATQFVKDGWSLKKMHRTMMLTSVYQQSSADNAAYAQKDPRNRWLWHANIRRLDLEAVRDSMLALGGKLDLTVGGRPVNLGASPYSVRRTLYGYVDRRNLPEIYTQFDFANPDIESGKRYETLVPQQALFFMNSPLVVEQARNMVGRSDVLDLRDPAERIAWLYKLIYQREPTAAEIKLGVEFIGNSPKAEKIRVGQLNREQQREKQRKQNKKGGSAMSLADIPASELQPVDAWDKYVHALLEANEAVFIN